MIPSFSCRVARAWMLLLTAAALGACIPREVHSLAPTATYLTVAAAAVPNPSEAATAGLHMSPASPRTPGPALVSLAEPSYPLGNHAKFMRTHVDIDFPESHRREIIRALEAWNYIMNGVIVLDTAPRPVRNNVGPALDALLETRGELVFLAYDPAPHETKYKDIYAVASADERAIHYMIPEVMNRPSIIFGVTMHEIAHVFGAKHDKKSTLMHPTFGDRRYRIVDPLTMLQVAAHLGVPPSRLRCTDTPCQFP